MTTKSWVYEAEHYKAAIGQISGGSTPLAVFDRATMEPLQFVSTPTGAGKKICDEWDVRLYHQGKR